MIEHAAQLAANAIIGVRYDANEITAGVTEVLAYGTAVHIEISLVFNEEIRIASRANPCMGWLLLFHLIDRRSVRVLRMMIRIPTRTI